jgi:hypothetical protein
MIRKYEMPMSGAPFLKTVLPPLADAFQPVVAHLWACNGLPRRAQFMTTSLRLRLRDRLGNGKDQNGSQQRQSDDRQIDAYSF